MTRARSRRRREGGVWLILAGGGLLLIALAAARDLWIEADIAVSRSVLRNQGLALSRGQVVAVPLAIAPGGVPRALVHRSLFLARGAARLSAGRERDGLLLLAATAIDRASAVRPLWAEALVATAYIDALRGDADSLSRGRAAFRSSYIAAPFLYGAAPWRIAYAASSWRDLGAQAQHAVLEEAVWVTVFQPDNRALVFDHFRRSAGYSAFMIRWREAALAR